MENYWNWTSTV